MDDLTARRYAGRADRFPPAGSDQDRLALISDEYYYFWRNAIPIGNTDSPSESPA